jgi:hypothetical protein
MLFYINTKNNISINALLDFVNKTSWKLLIFVNNTHSDIDNKTSPTLIKIQEEDNDEDVIEIAQDMQKMVL